MSEFDGYTQALKHCQDVIIPQAEKQAKREEQERILSYLKHLLILNPKTSLEATIDLIETTKPEEG